MSLSASMGVYKITRIYKGKHYEPISIYGCIWNNKNIQRQTLKRKKTRLSGVATVKDILPPISKGFILERK